jgi:cytochrome c oxidase assembly factor CtaG
MRPDPYAWAPHPEVLAGVVLIAFLYAAVRPRFHPSRARIAAFAAGLAMITAAVVSPLHSLSFHLLSMHLLQNVVLAEWAPALLVLGIPPALAAALGGNAVIRALTYPPAALGTWLLVYFTWHVPWVYDTALRHPDSLLHLEHGLYVLAGCLLWWPVIQSAPHDLSTGGRAVYVFAAFVLGSPLGLLLTLLPSPAYGFYEHGRVWGLSQLGDQQLAGGTMVGEQSVVFFAVFAFLFFRFLAEEEHRDDVAG